MTPNVVRICGCCKQDKPTIQNMVDFRGNSIGLFCGDCAVKVNDALLTLASRYGAYVEEGVLKSSPRNTPTINSWEELLEAIK